MKPCQPSAQAEADIDTAVDWYLQEAALETAPGFVHAYSAAFDHIARHPGTGSRGHGALVGKPDLRCWLLDRFPFSVFYVERSTHIEIIRVLHQASDIPAHLEEN